MFYYIYCTKRSAFFRSVMVACVSIFIHCNASAGDQKPCPEMAPYDGPGVSYLGRDGEAERNHLANYFNSFIVPVAEIAMPLKQLAFPVAIEVDVISLYAKTLMNIYNGHKQLLNEQSTIIPYMQAVNLMYAGKNTYEGLNTKTAIAIVSISAPELLATVGGTLMCVEPWKANKAFFATHIYGVNKSRCNKVRTSSTIHGLGNLYINGSSNGECAEDYLGWAPRPWPWYYGTNRVTMVFGKFKY